MCQTIAYEKKSIRRIDAWRIIEIDCSCDLNVVYEIRRNNKSNEQQKKIKNVVGLHGEWNIQMMAF